MRVYERSWWWIKEKKQMALVFITVTMILQFQMKACVGCLETEKMGLLQLKSFFNSPLADESRYGFGSWSADDPKSDCCKWERIKCSDAIGGHIVHLSLANLNLPQSRAFNLSLLHSFPQLKTLDFSYNSFDHLFDPTHGHKSLQRLEKLETLNMVGNHFNNNVLPFLSAARSLRILKIGGNRLKGVIRPNGLINLRELEELDLSFNSINDFEAGDGLKTMKLKTLDLSRNKFSDTARLKGLENLVELEVLSLGSNQFNNSQSIQVLKDMPKLQELYIRDSKLTDLDSLGLVLPPSLRVLDLRENQLSLTQKGYICGLVNLQELDLSYNTLTSMPNCLGNLSYLRTLDLSNNQFFKDLSSIVSSLPPKLEYLSLLDNSFNGSFLFNSLANQTKLTVFEMSSTAGMIQAQDESSWVPLFQLKNLKLHNFILGNKIPGFLVHQHDLCSIDISHNELTGPFPGWLVENNTRLQTILLMNTSLTKLQLPRFVHGLQVLDISSNKINDSIQADIGIVFPKLRSMKFFSNQFHGTIPSSMGEMKSLAELDVSWNGLSGQLPKPFLSGCYSLKFLVLSNNQFHGEIFPEYANLTSLHSLLLDGNNFNGSLGKGLLNSKGLSLLDMRGNQLKGPFPHQLQSIPLVVLDISHNSFSGLISRNVNFSNLRELSLQNNEFVGSIPDTFFKSETLLGLDLRNNNFSGKILNNIGNRSNLHFLLVGNNSLQSHIPEEICQLSKISILDLSHNKFKGPIPPCLGNMAFGTRGFEGYQGLSSLSTSVSTFVVRCDYNSTIQLNIDISYYTQVGPTTTVDFLTKRRYEAYQGGVLSYMSGLDLSSNKLSGQIPVEIGKLQNIKSLNLSSNRLTGSIPGSISNLKDLESFDLSNNILNGSIPPALADLNSLGYFNVSCNNLAGEVPFKGHLVTFDERSYTGNDHLCGLPTRINCNPARVPEPSALLQAKEEEDSVIDMVWFYWTCCAVYISTTLALFVFLYRDSRWSREWFYRVDLFVHHLQQYKRSFFGN